MNSPLNKEPRLHTIVYSYCIDNERITVYTQIQCCPETLLGSRSTVQNFGGNKGNY